MKQLQNARSFSGDVNEVSTSPATFSLKSHALPGRRKHAQKANEHILAIAVAEAPERTYQQQEQRDDDLLGIDEEDALPVFLSGEDVELEVDHESPEKL